MKFEPIVLSFLLLATTLVAAPTRNSNPKPFRANRNSQAIQNRQADKDGLSRLKDDRELSKFKKVGLLVPLPKIRGLEVKDLDTEWQFVRPQTARFLQNFAKAFIKKFPGGILQVTSAVRTVKRQKELRGQNSNATKATGKKASSHETGATIDITKNGMTKEEVFWFRRTLRPLHGKTIYVVEERRQPCFHIMVFKSYKKPKGW